MVPSDRKIITEQSAIIVFELPFVCLLTLRYTKQHFNIAKAGDKRLQFTVFDIFSTYAQISAPHVH